MVEGVVSKWQLKLVLMTLPVIDIDSSKNASICIWIKED